jgi:hypothetical protein
MVVRNTVAGLSYGAFKSRLSSFPSAALESIFASYCWVRCCGR